MFPLSGKVFSHSGSSGKILKNNFTEKGEATFYTSYNNKISSFYFIS
jgi:hypothetical protein